VSAARMHPDDLAALADLVADRLADRLLSAVAAAGMGAGPSAPVGGRERAGEQPAALMTAAEVGRRFQLSAEWVREHQDELGVIRIGNGRRPRLRFDPVKVAAALTPRERNERSEARTSPRRTARPSQRRTENSDNVLDFLASSSVKPRPLPRKEDPGDARTPRGLTTRGAHSSPSDRTPQGARPVALVRASEKE
jgi:hypothetical protein